MHQREFTTNPTALRIQAADRTNPQRSHAAAQELLRQAEAENEATTRRLLSLIAHDGQKDGRVSVRLLVKTVLGEPLPWEKP